MHGPKAWCFRALAIILRGTGHPVFIMRMVWHFCCILFSAVKRIFPYIAFMIVFLAPLLVQAASETYYFPTDVEQELIGLINDARQSPLDTAVSYGVRRAQVLSDFPEQAADFKAGLTPLSTHQALLRSANQHVQEMLNKAYYSKTSSDGAGPEDRMEAWGYLMSWGTERLGMLAYRNYMDADEAVALIFENMILDELDPDGSGGLCILDPDLTDVGVAVQAGEWEISGETLNVYMVVCDFGDSLLTEAESTLMVQINQARRFPLRVASVLDVSYADAVSAVPDLTDYLSGGLPALRMDSRLYWSASGHAWDMLEQDYLSVDSADGRTLKQRILAAGYPAGKVNEAIRVTATTEAADEMAVMIANLRRLLLREFDPDNTAVRSILNSSYTDAGPIVLGSTPEESSSEEGGLYDKYYIRMQVCDYAAKTSSTDTVGGVFGWGYVDENDNSLMDPGEETAEAAVAVMNSAGGLLMEAVTDSAGGFNVELPAGQYLVRMTAGTQRLTRRVQVNDSFVPVAFDF